MLSSVFPKVRVQILRESTVFLLTLAMLENHEIFSSCFSEDDSKIEKHKLPSKCLFNFLKRRATFQVFGSHYKYKFTSIYNKSSISIGCCRSYHCMIRSSHGDSWTIVGHVWFQKIVSLRCCSIFEKLKTFAPSCPLLQQYRYCNSTVFATEPFLQQYRYCNNTVIVTVSLLQQYRFCNRTVFATVSLL